jgi:hypothetical protein
MAGSQLPALELSRRSGVKLTGEVGAFVRGNGRGSARRVTFPCLLYAGGSGLGRMGCLGSGGSRVYSHASSLRPRLGRPGNNLTHMTDSGISVILSSVRESRPRSFVTSDRGGA